jgi:hypothetical protein
MAARAAAGPLASLLVALACRAGAVSLGGARGPAGTAEQVLWVAWWVGLSLAVINALPSRAPAGTLNDGALVAQALAGSGPGWVRYRFNVECALGHRPRDWAIPAPALLAALDDPGADRESLLLAAACVALDTGDDAQAGRILSRALDEPAPSPSMVRGELELQAAMLAAFQGRTAEARARLARVRGFGELPAYPRLAEAVLDACEGATEAAAAGLAAWEAALHGTGRASSIRVGNEWAVERLRSMVAASSRPRGAEA